MHTRKKGGNIGNKTRLFKKNNCHPKTKHNKILDHSCFTKNSIMKLREIFNKHHSDKKIITDDPKQIWEHLHAKIPECDRESCWLQKIPNKYLQDKLKKDLFSPTQPSEWKKKPNTWLTNIDIDAVIQQYEEANPDFLFLGPTTIDFDKIKNGKCVLEELCRLDIATEYQRGKRTFGFIFNLDTSDGSGTHWVSMFMDIQDPTPFLFYFNSTSEKTPTEVKVLMQRLKDQFYSIQALNPKKLKIIENTKIEHQNSNTECGMYSLFFIITCLTRQLDPTVTDEKTKLSVKQLIELFAGKTRVPDKLVEMYRGKYFND